MQSQCNTQCRNTLMLLGFLGSGILYVLRVNLSVAIVAMVQQSKNNKVNTNVGDSCPLTQSSLSLSQNHINGTTREFKWNEETQGIILSSFFYGYLITNFVGGRLADVFGGRRVYGFGVVLTSLLAFVLPASARYSIESFIFIRFLQGMTEGVTFPSFNSLMTHWVPPSERSYFMSRVFGGAQFGTVLTLAFSGWLAQTKFGWPSIFFLSGIIGILWGIAWFSFIYDRPSTHPTITEEEEMLIVKSLGKDKFIGKLRVPWIKIFTSLPFLATVLAHFGFNWGFYCLLTELPSYLASVHHFSMKNNGLISALPFLLTWIFSIVYANYINTLTKMKRLSTRYIRIMSTAIALFVPAVFLVFIYNAGCHKWIAVGLICVAVAANGTVFCGYLCGFQDLAPNYAGTLTGISNTVATIPGFLAPYLTGVLINNQPTIGQWNKVFMLTSFIYCICGSFYVSFMSSEVQSWNNYANEKKSIGEVKQV